MALSSFYGLYNNRNGQGDRPIKDDINSTKSRDWLFGFTSISLIPVSTDLSMTLEDFVPIMRCKFDNVSTIKSQD